MFNQRQLTLNNTNRTKPPLFKSKNIKCTLQNTGWLTGLTLDSVLSGKRAYIHEEICYSFCK